jgi:hypothetical protein
MSFVYHSSPSTASLHLGGVGGLQNPNYLTYCLGEQMAREAPNSLAEETDIDDTTHPEEILDIHSGQLIIVGAACYGKTFFCPVECIVR